MRTADVTGKVELPENVKMVMPGDNVTATFELISPVPLEAGMLPYSLFFSPKKNLRNIGSYHCSTLSVPRRVFSLPSY